MPMPALTDLVRPERCVVVTQEVQQGVVGPDAGLPQLADAARVEALPNIGRLLAGARRAGASVVHCVVARRPDGRGSNDNCRLFRSAAKFPVDLSPGSPGTAVLPEFGPEPQDIVLTRTTGLGPMGGTDLDREYRNTITDTALVAAIIAALGTK